MYRKERSGQVRPRADQQKSRKDAFIILHCFQSCRALILSFVRQHNQNSTNTKAIRLEEEKAFIIYVTISIFK